MENAKKKLQLKDSRSILVLHAPDEARAAINRGELAGLAKYSDGYSLPEDYDPDSECLLAFVFSRTDIADLAAALEQKLEKTAADPLLWFAYPKGSSRRYSADFNRDSGWDPVIDLGFEGVSQIAFDADWSILRFRRRSHIAKYTRKTTIGRG
jgi:hypothetical protein